MRSNVNCPMRGLIQINCTAYYFKLILHEGILTYVHTLFKTGLILI